MMRKGASHVDWAISMSIFLVYVLLMFIFLKPASEPPYSGNVLLDTVYSGLKNDTTYTIKKGYLEIRPTIDINENEKYLLRIRNLKNSGINYNWVTSDKAGLNHLTLVNESLGGLSMCKNLTAIPFDFVDENNPSRDVLEMVTNLKRGEGNVFWFLYSEDLEFCPHQKVNTKISDEECVSRDKNNNKINNCLLDSVSTSPESPKDITNFTYYFGIVEVSSAFSEERLNELKQTYENDYEGLKKAWNFPEDKNFNITIEKVS